MHKTKVEIYRNAFREVSQNIEGAENFIKQRIKLICKWKKLYVKGVFYFYIFLVFSVIV